MKFRTHGLLLILVAVTSAGSGLAGVVTSQVCSGSVVPGGGVLCTVLDAGSSGLSPLTTDMGPLTSSQTLVITYLSGSVNLFPMWVDFSFNPDGSLVNPYSAENWYVDGMDYNYLKPGSGSYPTVAGGDGTNHFAGGGANYDKYPNIDSVWGFWCTNLTTDTMAPGVVRFGSLVGTLDGGLDWFYIGYGTTIGAGTGIPIPDGATLSLAVFDASYGTNTGAFQVQVTDAAGVPEPSAILLAGAGLLGMALLRRRRVSAC